MPASQHMDQLPMSGGVQLPRALFTGCGEATLLHCEQSHGRGEAPGSTDLLLLARASYLHSGAAVGPVAQISLKTDFRPGREILHSCSIHWDIQMSKKMPAALSLTVVTSPASLLLWATLVYLPVSTSYHQLEAALVQHYIVPALHSASTTRPWSGFSILRCLCQAENRREKKKDSEHTNAHDGSNKWHVKQIYAFLREKVMRIVKFRNTTEWIPGS